MPTGLWTLNTLEFPKDAVESSLSDILETGDVPQRYYLSKTACLGILRRAKRRGKSLPKELEMALQYVLEAIKQEDGEMTSTAVEHLFLNGQQT
jgi:hypothetical protein